MEKNETVKNDDSVVSGKELEAIEQQVLQKDREANAEIIKAAEDKVRKEMETEAKLRALEEEKAKMEEVIKQQAQEKKEKDEAYSKLQEQVGTTKSIRPTNSPFLQQPTTDNTFSDSLDDEERIREIEDASQEAFLKHHGLSEAQWSGGRK